MSKRIKTLIRIIAFTVVMLLSIGGVYSVVKWKDTTGGYLSSTSQLYATDDNLMDVVFVGSSHVYAGIYPEYLWEERGISAFNMSTSGQDKDTSYHDLVELCKTQSPKVVFVDLYGVTFDRHAVEGNVYRNYLSLKTSWNSIQHIRDYVDKEEQLDYIFGWPIVHTRYRELDKYDFVQYEPSIYGRGAYFAWPISPQSGENMHSGDYYDIELAENNKAWIDGLVALSEAENFKLYFMVIPFGCYSDESRMEVLAAIDYAACKGVDTIDFRQIMDEVGIDPATDFLDDLHLNGYGAEKVTRYIGDNILTQYELVDHRGDECYEIWEKDLEWFHLCEAKRDLNTAPNPEAFLGMLKENPRLTAVISLEGDMNNFGMDYFSIIETIGVPYSEVISGGKWLLRDGKVTKIMENEPGSEFVLELSSSDTLRVTYVSDFTSRNVMIGKEWLGSAGTFMGVTVYDELLGEYVMTKGF